MLKKSLLLALALVLLPVSMVISTGTASAAVETESTLNGRLLTTAELRAALKSNGTDIDVARSVDIPDIGATGLVSSGRIWEAKDGSILFDALLSYTDGRALPDSRVNEVLSGQFAMDLMTGFFDSNEFLGGLDSVLDERDVAHAFNARRDGVDFQVASISFIRGNIFGVVFYATADNQGTEVLSAFGGQTAKLPK